MIDIRKVVEYVAIVRTSPLSMVLVHRVLEC